MDISTLLCISPASAPETTMTLTLRYVEEHESRAPPFLRLGVSLPLDWHHVLCLVISRGGGHGRMWSII